MVTIQSFIKIENEFIPVTEFRREIPDPFYIEGAIELNIDNKEFLTKNHWDLIDQLWSYFTNCFEELFNQEEQTIYFPDQPINLTLKLDKKLRQIKLKLIVPESRFVNHPPETRLATTSLDEFLTMMNEAGQGFFSQMMEIIPEERDGYECEAWRLSKSIAALR